MLNHSNSKDPKDVPIIVKIELNIVENYGHVIEYIINPTTAKINIINKKINKNLNIYTNIN